MKFEQMSERKKFARLVVKGFKEMKLPFVRHMYHDGHGYCALAAAAKAALPSLYLNHDHMGSNYDLVNTVLENRGINSRDRNFGHVVATINNDCSTKNEVIRKIKEWAKSE